MFRVISLFLVMFLLAMAISPMVALADGGNANDGGDDDDTGLGSMNVITSFLQQLFSSLILGWWSPI